MRLENKVALITGGGPGIGEAIAFKFAREGASIMVAARSSTVDETAKNITAAGGSAQSYRGDLADDKQMQACVEATLEAFGKLDILINNAGVLDTGSSIENFPIEKFDDILRKDVATPPALTLPLKHSRDGDRNKKIKRAA
jgi:NAD(P)-dependent dehydrogenase (short-subunit alcohol dehydrogenase family)